VALIVVTLKLTVIGAGVTIELGVAAVTGSFSLFLAVVTVQR